MNTVLMHNFTFAVGTNSRLASNFEMKAGTVASSAAVPDYPRKTVRIRKVGPSVAREK